ncbi:MAG: sugar transferase [Clostridia bacterium]|nr:sugar transferase [Clostridia bacterium]
MHGKGFYEKYLKRPFDLTAGLLGLILLSPVFAAVALLVRVKLGSPVLFKQERPGLGGRIFRIFKFRTMTDKRDENGALLPDSERLTGFGKALRASSLDELPELINLIRGDMSIVGPRPLLIKYLPLYNERQARRHEVRPGVTGLAQVHGRNAITWEEKFEWDVKYVDNVTFLGDLKIIFATVGAVLRREGINGKNSVTMEEFKGSEGNYNA